MPKGYDAQNLRMITAKAASDQSTVVKYLNGGTVRSGVKYRIDCALDELHLTHLKQQGTAPPGNLAITRTPGNRS